MNFRMAAVLGILALGLGCEKEPAAAAPPHPTPVKSADPLVSPPKASDIPAHPDKLKYGKIDWEVPTAEKHRTVLKNGMIVYAIEDRSLPKTDMTILLRAGQFWEPKGKEGLASMTG
ncbi:MAG TPA: hypothetical protein VFC86_00265, partial [Planctomycetota bacterium]|nr:hypothetical protein [Planctomycetota bacterium]